MALIERLAYTSEVELMHDCPTNTKIPDHVLRIGHTDTCPYCGAELDNIRDHVLDAYDDRNPYHIIDHECRTCGWWRHREFPNHFTNGFWRIGTLYNTPKSAAETWSAKLDELWRDNSKLFKMEPTDFERFVGGALRELYNCEVVHVGKAHDGGVDLILLDSDDGQVPIQVKRRSDPNRVEGVAVIRELRGAMVLVGASEGMFVTTAKQFSPSAKEIAEPKPEHLVPQKIHLIDGRRLLDIMALIKNSGENNHYINVSGAALTNQLKAGLRSDPDLIFKGLLAMIDRQKSADETHRIISKWWDEHYRNKPEKH